MKMHENQSVAYIGEMTHELAEMAQADGLELLAYVLQMAKLEAQSAAKKSDNVQHQQA